MANEPPIDGALTVTLAFFFLIVQPAIASNEGLDFLEKEFESIDTGNGMIGVEPGTHFILRDNCTLEFEGEVALDDMKGSINLEYDMQWGSERLRGKTMNICVRAKSMNGETKKKFHVLLDCFLSLAKVNDDCSIPEQKITHGFCDFSEHEDKMKAFEAKLEITNGDRTAMMNIGKKH